MKKETDHKKNWKRILKKGNKNFSLFRCRGIRKKKTLTTATQPTTTIPFMYSQNFYCGFILF